MDIFINQNSSTLFFMYKEDEKPISKSSDIPDKYKGLFVEHFHTFYELLFFLEGDVDIIVQGIRYRLRPSDLVLIKPGEHHYIVANEGIPYRRSVFYFSDSNINANQIIQRLRAIPTVQNHEGSPLTGEFRRLKHLFENINEKYYDVALQGQLMIILSVLLSNNAKDRKAEYINSELENLIEYIDAHFTEIYKAEDIYSKYPMSPSTIQKLFTNGMKTSLMSYVRTKKCFFAKKLLDDGIPAKVVFRQCGFKTYSTFYRDFISTYGVAPTNK